MSNQSKISVIIPCYNHANYLPAAINSILSQNYQNYEIIVVDDGSTDNTRAVSEKFSEIIYVHQQNQGTSAARNTGIEKSTGQFLVFLDADDWFVPDAFLINATCLEQNPDLAFVSGAHKVFHELIDSSVLVESHLKDSPYCHLLERNYIGMLATVMFRRWVFDVFKYDTSLKACEDYDMYLRITRKYSILSHTGLIAVYRYHNTNFSGDHLIMLNTALQVLKRQKKLLKNSNEEDWYRKGIFFWKWYYSKKSYDGLLVQFEDANQKIRKRDIENLLHWNKLLLLKFVIHVIKGKMRLG